MKQALSEGGNVSSKINLPEDGILLPLPTIKGFVKYLAFNDKK